MRDNMALVYYTIIRVPHKEPSRIFPKKLVFIAIRCKKFQKTSGLASNFLLKLPYMI